MTDDTPTQELEHEEEQLRQAAQAELDEPWEYSVADLARLTGRSRALIGYYIRRGILPSRKVPGYRGRLEHRVPGMAVDILVKRPPVRVGPGRPKRRTSLGNATDH